MMTSTLRSDSFDAIDLKCVPYIKHMPYFKDKTLFLAVCYAEVLFTTEKQPMQTAVYNASKRYNVDMTTIAKVIGRWSWNRKNNITGKDANFKK